MCRPLDLPLSGDGNSATDRMLRAHRHDVKCTGIRLPISRHGCRSVKFGEHSHEEGNMDSTSKKMADIRATIEHLEHEGKLDAVFGQMMGVILNLDGVLGLFQEMKAEGVLFPKAPEEFRDEFDEMLATMKSQVNEGILPEVVFVERPEAE